MREPPSSVAPIGEASVSRTLRGMGLQSLDLVAPLRGPRTVDELHVWRDAPRFYPSAGYHANPRGGVPFFDVRNHLPTTPPAGWSLPVGCDEGPVYSMHTTDALVQVAGGFASEKPYVVVWIAARNQQPASEENVTDILGRIRACSDFLEWTGDRRAAAVPDDMPWVRVFAARAQRATSDSWGAIGDD